MGGGWGYNAGRYLPGPPLVLASPRVRPSWPSSAPLVPAGPPSPSSPRLYWLHLGSSMLSLTHACPCTVARSCLHPAVRAHARSRCSLMVVRAGAAGPRFAALSPPTFCPPSFAFTPPVCLCSPPPSTCSFLPCLPPLVPIPPPLFSLHGASDRAHSRIRSHQPCLAFVRACSRPLVCLTFIWVRPCSFVLFWAWWSSLCALQPLI